MMTLSAAGRMPSVEPDGNLQRFLAGDDDSGQEFNSKITLRLAKGTDYLIRLRLFFSWDDGPSAIMIT